MNKQIVFPQVHFNSKTFIVSDLPKFGEPITNVTVPVGREAIMGCLVEDLGQYKVRIIDIFTEPKLGWLLI